MNIGFLRYDTRYFANINGQEVNFKDSSQACFSKLFYQILDGLPNKSIPLHFELILCLSNDRLEKNYSNRVFLTQEEIRYYLNELSNMIKFEYELKKQANNEYILDIKSNEIPYKYKWFITCLRYMYEYPFNLALKDAVFLKTNKKFVNINLLNVFNIIGSSMSSTYGWNTNHTCGDHDYLLKLVNYVNLKRIIDNKLPNSGICDGVYEPVTEDRNVELAKVNRIDDITDAYFEPNAIYNRYKSVYWNNYKLLKSYKNYIQK